ncbi:WD repeat-containing protein 43 [Halotydeus destructor]|nr:WD repeat-containing protein 43 [Halotydeus destructor]
MVLVRIDKNGVDKIEKNNNEENMSPKKPLLKSKNSVVNNATPKKIKSEESPIKKSESAMEVDSPKIAELSSKIKDKPAVRVSVKNDGSAPPKTDSLIHLLVQGLQSGDQKMLDTVLCKRDDTMISNTIGKLPLDLIAPLLHELQRLLHYKGDNNIIAMKWLEILLHTKLSFILTLPDLEGSLASLLQLLNSRTDVFDRLLRLKGRLGLMLSQVKVEPDVRLNAEALLRYQEESSSSEDEGDDDDDADSFDEDMNEVKEEEEDGEEADQDLSNDESSLDEEMNADEKSDEEVYEISDSS